MTKDMSASQFARFVKASSRLLGYSALASWLGFVGLFLHYDATRPILPQPSEGNVYPSNNHGHVVYLSEQDEHQLNLLQMTAFGLVVVVALLEYIQQRQLTASQIHRAVLSTCYWLCSPSSWLASLQQLRQHNAESLNKHETSHLEDYKSHGRISFRTLKSISECQKVVRSAGYSAFGIVLESFDGYNFTLSVRRNYRNSFAPLCTGKLIPQAAGTVIDVRFGMSLSVKLFLAVWFTGIATAGVVILSNILSGNAVHATTGVVVPPVLLGFGILLVRFGNRLAHDEENYVLGWLERSFANATPEHDTTARSGNR
jgi:hypothetical protein